MSHLAGLIFTGCDGDRGDSYSITYFLVSQLSQLSLSYFKKAGIDMSILHMQIEAIPVTDNMSSVRTA
jgi:hypothetical protein